MPLFARPVAGPSFTQPHQRPELEVAPGDKIVPARIRKQMQADLLRVDAELARNAKFKGGNLRAWVQMSMGDLNDDRLTYGSLFYRLGGTVRHLQWGFGPQIQETGTHNPNALSEVAHSGILRMHNFIESIARKRL